jgi:hypothetical protein
MYLSKALVVAKYLLMALIGSSYDLFGFLGMAQPMFYTWAIENKLFAIMMTFFFGSKYYILSCNLIMIQILNFIL